MVDGRARRSMRALAASERQALEHAWYAMSAGSRHAVLTTLREEIADYERRGEADTPDAEAHRVALALLREVARG